MVSYPYTFIFHLAVGLLSGVSTLYLLSKKKSSPIPTVQSYFNWFLFFALYNFTLVLSVLLFAESPFALGIGYIIALFFLGLGAWQAFLLNLYFICVKEPVRNLLSLFYLGGIIFTLLLHGMFFGLPTATADGNWIFWYPNQMISFLYIIFMFAAGWSVTIVMGRYAPSLPQGPLKTRSILFSLASFLFPFAALLYFAATNVVHLYISCSLVVLSLVLLVIGNAGVRISKD
ncbi:hypothetical protein KKI17_00090 [Patescibacteria group bacterium]|nr:hypothetical protein [Patescibacteria group bacterium]